MLILFNCNINKHEHNFNLALCFRSLFTPCESTHNFSLSIIFHLVVGTYLIVYFPILIFLYIFFQLFLQLYPHLKIK